VTVPRTLTARALAAVVVASAWATGLAGCAAPPPVLDPDPIPAQPPAAVLAVQTDRILAELAAQITKSAETGSVEGLTRLAGAAAEMRAAEAATHAIAPDEIDFEPLGTEFAGTAVAATDTWPRSFAAVTTPSDAGAQYLYLITQADARSPYAMTSWVRLVAGATMPETAPPETGSAVLDPADPGTAAFAPADALAAYATAKDNPQTAEAELFAAGSDPARDAWAALVERWGAALAPIAGTVVPSSSTDGGSVYALATADGGAIAFGTVRSTLTLEIPGDVEGQSFTLAPYLGALGAASTTVTKAAAIEFAQPVVLALPPAGSDAPIAVLGVAQVPVRVTTQ
jgi:hypothetical protein